MSGQGDLSITALYTSECWAWGGLPGAELLRSDDGKRVFGVVNVALAAARPFLSSPSPLPEGLLHRHVLLDRLVAEARPSCVVELAAGLSRRGVTLSAEPSLAYVEVDLPAVLARKRELLGRTEAGRAALARPNLALVEADVRDADFGALARGEGPLAIVAEGLLVYLPAEAQRSLFARAAAVVRARGGLFAFDLVPGPEEPPPGAAGRALSGLMKRFTGGQTFVRDARTRDDLLAELREAGFASAEAIEPSAVAAARGLPFPGVRTRQVVFAARC